MPYKPTKERESYLERTESLPLPIEGDVIQIGKYRGKTTGFVSKKDPRWFKWACENVRDFKSLSGAKVTWR